MSSIQRLWHSEASQVQAELFRRRSLADVGLDGSLESLRVCADNLGYLVAVLEEKKSGHGADTEFLGNVGDFVNVELVEAGIWVGVGESVGVRSVL